MVQPNKMTKTFVAYIVKSNLQCVWRKACINVHVCLRVSALISLRMSSEERLYRLLFNLVYYLDSTFWFYIISTTTIANLLLWG
jgi:hypothetical protein